jgi:glycosyltransferase involved in cell wall biosynthesis
MKPLVHPSPIHVSVCVCTYQRPVWLRRLLLDLGRQETRGLFAFDIVVADNDAAESGRAVATELAAASPVKIRYCVEPRRSIAHVRNQTLAQSHGDAIAFIDDDEFPHDGWLLNLFQCWQKSGVAGVLGPVRPSFDENAPAWVKKGGFYDRPEHQTGFVMPWQECRTGNVLFARSITEGINPVFNPDFGTGGSDVEFFRKMMEAGHKFIWCNEAVVSEVVPPSRWNRRVMMKRALLRGGNSFRHPAGRCKNLAKAVVAVPLYAAALPFLQLAGHHLFMRYLVKLCDHSGRLLAPLGIHPVRQRHM